ncbi:hypothetical protein SAMN05444579_12738 [Delftia tsuruhatensis]|nr:hypothetical protein SAMN05444579_12738 [Delftia tsuruhatensis]
MQKAASAAFFHEAAALLAHFSKCLQRTGSHGPRHRMGVSGLPVPGNPIHGNLGQNHLGGAGRIGLKSGIGHPCLVAREIASTEKRPCAFDTLQLQAQMCIARQQRLHEQIARGFIRRGSSTQQCNRDWGSLCKAAATLRASMPSARQTLPLRQSATAGPRVEQVSSTASISISAGSASASSCPAVFRRSAASMPPAASASNNSSSCT